MASSTNAGEAGCVWNAKMRQRMRRTQTPDTPWKINVEPEHQPIEN